MASQTRLDSDKTEDKSYGVREMARKAVMIDFVRQLFLNEMDCKPIVDDEFLTYLAIYAKLHADAKDNIFVAVQKMETQTNFGSGALIQVTVPSHSGCGWQ